MLKSLFVSSFVIIDQITVDFTEGMCVLTGETGAGKSIIIDAIGQLCGNRASASLVRKGAKKAVIEGLFEVTQTEALMQVFEDLGIDYDDEIIITKEILLSGKSTVKINYRHATNNALKMLAPLLIHLHSQFETQTLFAPAHHITLLDQFQEDSLKPLKKQYDALYEEYQDIYKKRRQLEEEDFSDEQIEYYTAQYNELKDLSYSDDDIDELENELQVLKDYEKLNTYIESLSAVLDHSTGAIEQIHEAVRIMSHLSDYPDFADDYDQLYNLYYSLIDIDDHIHMTFSRYDFNEYRFNELQDELYRIARLKRKYGYSMDAIYEARDQLAERIEQASHRDELLSSLRQQETKSYEALNQCGEALHAQRLKIAHLFEKKLSQELIDLYLPNAAFKVDIKRIKPTATGIDQVTFLVAMNKGAHLSTLNETASGGEISRLMLAIKTITLNNSAIDTIIFDEVDTGVSGKVADAIGEKMHHLALNKQVICVTHLPQVAVHGDHHFAIKKKDVDDMTYSNMVQLDIEGQIQEIAQMLSGNEITQEAILNAKKLLKLS